MTLDGPERYHDRVRLEPTAVDAVVRLVMERGRRPANAFDAEMVDSMTAALEALPSTAGCFVLQGEEEFSVGADLSAVRDAPSDERPAVLDEIAGASNRFIVALRDLDVPTIAAVNGTAAGGGLGFALACDLLVMHVGAVLDPAYARIGLTPDNGVPYFLAHALGPYRAMELLLDPRALDAEEAEAVGLVSDTVGGDPSTFDRRVLEVAESLANYPAPTMVATRDLVRTALTASLDDHLTRERQTIREIADTPAFEEGLAAFFEHRPPDWTT